jgi:hypothetical protein
MPTKLRAALAVVAAVALAPGLAAAQTRPAARPAPAAPGAVKRVIYRMETLQTGELSPEVLEKLKPLNTLAECEAVLKAADMPFTWGKAEYDSDVIGPAFVRQLEALPPGEVFVVPRQGGGTLIGVIIGRH